jgi:RimJ/RimL family protein N-acetyltransferase
VLEPLAPAHEPGLWDAAQDPRTWRFFTVTPTADRATFRAWLDDALARSAEGAEAAFATVDAASGRPIGSTRYLNIRPEHRVLEIGSTWLAPEAWGTGANTEAKLLQLELAFERLGARAPRSPRCPRASKASSASTCSSATARAATRPGTRSSTTSGRT